MKAVCVGIDVGSSSCKLAVIEKETRQLMHRATVPPTERALKEQLEALRNFEVHVHLEASELAEWVRAVCKPLAKRVVVSHPNGNAYIARDFRKNDKVDALKLAELLALEKFVTVYYQDDERRAEFKRLVQMHDRVVKAVAQRKNGLKSALRRIGIIEKGRDVYSEEGKARVLKCVEESFMASEATRMAMRELFALLEVTTQHRRNLQKVLRRMATAFDEIERFQGVPGVGFISACRFCAYIGDPKRFSNKRKLWQYCGLGVSARSSDDKPLGRESLDPRCVHVLKSMSRACVLAAMRCHDPNPIKSAFEAAVKHDSNETHARLTAQRKILAILRALWIGGTRYNAKTDDSVKE